MASNEEKIDLAKRICTVLHEDGKECYMVGGAVRDMIRGASIHDVDIATNATPLEVSGKVKDEWNAFIQIDECKI